MKQYQNTHSHDKSFGLQHIFWLVDVVWFMVFNDTFYKMLVISWRSVLLVEEIVVPGEKTIDLPQVIDNLYHIMLYPVHLAMNKFELTTLVVIGTDCTGSCKSNYHTIMATTAPHIFWWYDSFFKKDHYFYITIIHTALQDKHYESQ